MAHSTAAERSTCLEIRVLSNARMSWLTIARGILNAAGVEEPAYKNAAHHIVAGGSPKAKAAQDKLKELEIGLNDSSNGVFLPTEKDIDGPAYHPTLHTNTYYDTVNERLAKAKTKKQAEKALDKIRKELLAGTFPK